MVTFELNENAVLTEQEREQLAKAKKMPIVYDGKSLCRRKKGKTLSRRTSYALCLA